MGMTEDEHIQASKLVTEFCVQLGRAAAQALAPFTSETRAEVMYMLQDATSLYAPFTAEVIDEELRRLDNYPF